MVDNEPLSPHKGCLIKFVDDDDADICLQRNCPTYPKDGWRKTRKNWLNQIHLKSCI